MKVTIKETRIITLNVEIERGAAKAAVEKAITEQLAKLPLVQTSYTPRGGEFLLCKDGVLTSDGKLARCEVCDEPKVENRVIVSMD